METYGDFLGFEDLYDARIHTEDGYQFPVHRVLLALRSKYFHHLWCVEGKKDADVLVPTVRGPIMKIIIDYLYTGDLELTECNISMVIVAAQSLCIENLLQKCRYSAFRLLRTTNCVSVLLASLKMNDWNLSRGCARYITVNFQGILADSDSEFQKLPYEYIEKFLSLDNVNVLSEYTIWNAIVTWVNHDPERRKAHIVDLVPCIRSSEHEKDLATEIMNHPLVTDNPCFYRIKEIINLCSYASKYRRPQNIFFFTKFYINRSDYTEGIKVYTTYDEEIDFSRNIGSKFFTPETVLHGAGPLLMMFDTGLNVIHSFNVVSKAWESIIPPLGVLREYYIVKLGRFIYVLGGRIPGHEEDEILKLVQRYDFESGQWEVTTSLLHAVSQGAAVVFNNRIYIMGTSSDFYSEEMLGQCYNPNTDSWTLFNPPNIYRRMFAFVIFRNQLFVLGGHSSDGFLKSVEVYNSETDKWKNFKELPFRYFLPKAAIIKDVLYVYDSHIDNRQHFCPPVLWDDIIQQWHVIESSSPYCNLHLYQFCAIDDSEVIMAMQRENRDPHTKWNGSPFFKYA